MVLSLMWLDCKIWEEGTGSEVGKVDTTLDLSEALNYCVELEFYPF